MRVVEIRVILDEDDMKDTFLRDLGHWAEGEILGVSELQNDGFGHLIPRGYAEIFISDLDRPMWQKVHDALEKGEV